MIKFMQWWIERFEEEWDDGDPTPVLLIPFILSLMIGGITTVAVIVWSPLWFWVPGLIFGTWYIAASYFDNDYPKSVGQVLGYTSILIFGWIFLVLVAVVATIAFTFKEDFPQHKGRK